METYYKVFRIEILKQINIEEIHFGIEQELTVKVAKLGCRIYDVGISYSAAPMKRVKKSTGKMIYGLSAVS